jgi:hypothetical protein
LRPDFASLADAFGQGLRAGRSSLRPMLVLEAAMAAMVAIYYFWPAGSTLLTTYATWQRSGGLLAAALATGLAGGVLSEISLVYFQDRGRWSARHFEHMAFKFALFCFNGAVVAKFYLLQAFWFGDSVSWGVLLRKIVVDQFLFTPFWSTPFSTIALRWHALRYSGSKLRRDLDSAFVTRRLLPVLVTNWMFWIPGVVFIYSMPTLLQTPLFIFAMAVWGILLPAVTRQEREGIPVRELVPSELEPLAGAGE